MATADISQVGRSIWANTIFDRVVVRSGQHLALLPARRTRNKALHGVCKPGPRAPTQLVQEFLRVRCVHAEAPVELCFKYLKRFQSNDICSFGGGTCSALRRASVCRLMELANLVVETDFHQDGNFPNRIASASSNLWTLDRIAWGVPQWSADTRELGMSKGPAGWLPVALAATLLWFTLANDLEGRW